MLNPKPNRRRVAEAKRAFVTRRADFAEVRSIRTDLTPRAGDLCLARVIRLGHHQRLELTDGRRARLFPGDEIVVALLFELTDG